MTVKELVVAAATVMMVSPTVAAGEYESVDPFWGSGGVELSASEGMARGWNWEKAQTGNTHPGAVMPFGWVSACAYTGGYSSGYGRFRSSSSGTPYAVHPRQRAYGISHFHQSGTGWIGQFYNYVLSIPFSDGASVSKPSRLEEEVARPGYYAATLTDYGVSFELTAAPFAACHRYKFAKGGGRLRIDISKGGIADEYVRYPKYRRIDYPSHYEAWQTARNRWQGRIRAHGRDLFFAICASSELHSSSCKDGVIDIAFAGDLAETAMGFSLVSESEAVCRAEDASRKGFDTVRQFAAKAWKDALGRVRADFSDSRIRTRFYSALYHSMIKPSDCGNGYVDFATLWDMYRTAMPLAFSFAPATGRGIALHILSTIDRYGYSPICQLMDGKMVSRDGQATALPVYTIADAFFRGVVRKVEYPRLKTAFQRELSNGANVSKMSPTHSLDLSGAYGAAAYVAEACGDLKYAKELRGCARMSAAVYDSGTGLLPEKETYYEGNHWNYSFRPHPGMDERIAFAGGPRKYEGLLDRFFCVGENFSGWDPNSDRIRRPGHFEGLNNESDMDSPFAYIWCGRLDRTVEVVDSVRRFRFGDGEGGCPGNNDSGSTSSWYVWACLGIYPLTGTPWYLLGSPLVDSAELDFAEGTLKIKVERESRHSIYPVSFIFNGHDSLEPWLAVRQLEKGGTLVFKLVDKPQRTPSPIPEWL